MLALGLLLNFAGIGLFCCLIFTLAVYALPFFVGLTVFMMALQAVPASSERRLLALLPAG